MDNKANFPEIDRLKSPDSPDCMAEQVPWSARWIWTADTTNGSHDFVFFRRDFKLNKKTPAALLYVTAEREYVLWINGAFIGRGPVLSDPRFKRFDIYEVSLHLRKGDNCIAALVYHDISRCRWTAHAEARGFLCQLEVEDFTLVSDETWSARRCSAYLPAPIFDDSTIAEIYDSRQEPVGWQKAGFNDAAWPQAVPVISERHGLWGSPQAQARFYPWVNLIPSDLASLCYERRYPQQVIESGEVLQRREAGSNDVAVRMSLEHIEPGRKTEIKNVNALTSVNKGPVCIRNSDPHESVDTFDGLRNATIVLDFGRLMNARLGFEIEAPEGACLDIGYAYHLEDGRVVPYISNRTPMADQYICREGKQSWQAYQWRHFRYAQLTFRNLPDKLLLFNVWAEEVCNRFQDRGVFESSDELLNTAFTMSKQTAKLCIVDHTMDNPSRERKQYLGDCSGILPAVWSCFGDAAIIRKYFKQIDEGQHRPGLYRYSYPGHDDDYASLFDHSLSLPLRLYEHYMLYADKELVKYMWPGLKRFIDFANSCLDQEGLMGLLPYSLWFDWAYIQREGYSFILNAMHSEVLARAVVLAEAIDETGCVELWQETSNHIKEALRKRWYDEQKGVFVDALIDGGLGTHVSEHTMSLAILFNIATPEQIRKLMDLYTHKRESFGAASPAWIYLPLAFIRAARPDLAIDWVHRHFGKLGKQGLETIPELWCLYGENTPGYWRCRNSRAVAQGAGLGVPYALLSELCGIQPYTPGFDTVRFAPNPGPLNSMHGSFPGPDGEYKLSYQKEDTRQIIKMILPKPKPVILDIAFASSRDTVIIDGKPAKSEKRIYMPNGIHIPRFYLEAKNSTRTAILKSRRVVIKESR